MKPYLILDEYHPLYYNPDKWNKSGGWRCWSIGEALTTVSAKLGLIPLKDPKHPAQDWTPWNDLKLHAEVKKWTPENPQGEDWHKDGDTTPGARMDCAILLWSSKCPTQFDFKGKIYQPNPFELVIFHNQHCSHRRPPNAPENRFIFRQRVEIPKHMELP